MKLSNDRRAKCLSNDTIASIVASPDFIFWIVFLLFGGAVAGCFFIGLGVLLLFLIVMGFFVFALRIHKHHANNKIIKDDFPQNG